MKSYAEKIKSLIEQHPLEIDTEIRIEGRVPSSASSEFLTNKAQGDWAEQLVISAINAVSSEYVAMPYGRADSIAAGDEGFKDFYANYQNELNTIGKRPDILIFRRSDVPADGIINIEDDELISKAKAAIEVRSSSFLSLRYMHFMEHRCKIIEDNCLKLCNALLEEPYGGMLKKKSPDIYSLLSNASASTFHDLDFRAASWSSSPELQHISALLRQLKDNVKILHKREYLSITPKVEDLALVNRWIQRYHVPHYYLQVFFDRGYVISFEDILKISSSPELEGSAFSIEKDVKNQGKTTIKVNISKGQPIIGKIEMPQHSSVMKELARGRLLFYVTFSGGKGFLDLNLLEQLLK